MTPLVLLVLLAFFFIVALSFTVWAALTVGSAARRGEQQAANSVASGRTRDMRQSEPRERKPWERVPEPPAPKERRQRAKRPEEKRGAQDAASAPRERGPVVQGTLWEKRPDSGPASGSRGTAGARGQTTTALRTEPAKPSVKQSAQPAASAKPSADSQLQPSGRAVVTPRKPNGDAFERFLESEKRRD